MPLSDLPRRISWRYLIVLPALLPVLAIYLKVARAPAADQVADYAWPTNHKRGTALSEAELARLAPAVRRAPAAAATAIEPAAADPAPAAGASIDTPRPPAAWASPPQDPTPTPAAVPPASSSASAPARALAYSRAPAPPGVAADLEATPLSIPEGTTIPAILETTLITDNFSTPATVRIPTDYHFHGALAIPADTRAIGRTARLASPNQERILVMFHKLVLPDDREVPLRSAVALMPDGSGGLSGRVNRHRVRGGIRAIVGAVTGIGALLLGRDFERPYSSGDALRDTAGRNLLDFADDEARQALTLFPSVTVPRGARVLVYLDAPLALAPPARPGLAGPAGQAAVLPPPGGGGPAVLPAPRRTGASALAFSAAAPPAAPAAPKGPVEGAGSPTRAAPHGGGDLWSGAPPSGDRGVLPPADSFSAAGGRGLTLAEEFERERDQRSVRAAPAGGAPGGASGPASVDWYDLVEQMREMVRLMKLTGRQARHLPQLIERIGSAGEGALEEAREGQDRDPTLAYDPGRPCTARELERGKLDSCNPNLTTKDPKAIAAALRGGPRVAMSAAEWRETTGALAGEMAGGD